MVKVVSFTKTGNKSEAQTELDAAIFGLQPNADLIGLAYRAYLANGRSAQAKTLTRGEVRGGGKKPWRQKGTGRARVGSSRVPNWTGGGVVFGPTGEENHTVKLPVSIKRQAIRQALSIQTKDGKVAVIEAFDAKDGKVKPTVELLGKLKAQGNILLAVDDRTDMIDRATRNVAGLKCVQARYLNVFDIMNADLIILTKPALEAVKTWLGGK